MKEKYAQLRNLVEKTLGVPLRTPRDFELLSKQIYHRTRQSLSVSTLKRFWGYIDKGRDETHVRISTLDILSEYAGFQNWVMFCQSEAGGVEDGGTMANRFLFARELEIGAHVRLSWKPDREMTIRYEGKELFTVVESIRGKLRPGDTFHCAHIVEGMPLTLMRVVRDGQPYANYVCGKTQGISFALV